MEVNDVERLDQMNARVIAQHFICQFTDNRIQVNRVNNLYILLLIDDSFVTSMSRFIMRK